MDEYAQLLLQAARESGLFSLVSEREQDEITGYPLMTIGRNVEYDPVSETLDNTSVSGALRFNVYLINEGHCTRAEADTLRSGFLKKLFAITSPEFSWVRPFKQYPWQAGGEEVLIDALTLQVEASFDFSE